MTNEEKLLIEVSKQLTHIINMLQKREEEDERIRQKVGIIIDDMIAERRSKEEVSDISMTVIERLKK